MTTDELISKGLSNLDTKLQQVSTTRPKSWKTTCVYELNGQKLNIQVVKDLNILVIIRGQLNDIARYFKEAKSIVELEPVYAGFPIVDWLSDVSTRMKFLANEVATERLLTMKKTLEGLMTEDQKREQSVKDLLKSFPDLFK